MTQVYTCRPTT